MQQYRAYIKSRTNPNGKPFTNADTRVTSFKIKRDLLNSAQSSISLYSVPSAIDIGDIIGVYDEIGRVVFNGIVKTISDKTIQCDQMTGIFADKWLYRTGTGNTLEEKLNEIIDTDFRNSDDIVISSCFKPFNVSINSSTNGDYPTEKEHAVKDFSAWIYKIYEDYDIIVDMKVPFKDGETPTMKIGKNTSDKVTLADNSVSILSVTPTTEVVDINKLIVYSKEGVYRETWYASPSGITNNSKKLDRLKVVKTKIVFSDDEIETLKSSNLPSEFYNHKITTTLSLHSKLYNFWDFSLGQKFKIIYEDTYYDSIFTGYSLDYDGQSVTEVEMTFGKARINLENKIYRIIHG